ncbi:PTS ascorbate transporter subunit IIC [Bacillus cereus group sp. MYBK249-1]|uniref:PTS ascorbate transporter subunit IIC n=1 Tax=Bacillus toyonensis TaxID=155322 RepID=A0AB73SI63_9BACI|nr:MULTISPECIES: hypothetical protein [Bacillus]MCU5026556.1 PTS ascorbate transporter subunit IIC [Bacillus cereus]RFB67656.1 PTS ascorbate transporter subunit IIC [Bacillus sp. AW]KAF6687753.1 PTS ascorbate transporter subunit IIC [Bacillus sp. EKM501B]MCU5121274.1 PTS ascorbate transporter subunit IIC [Bacillus cereus]MCU5182565.1 PTS ascorbate transporter subunit IIC [Bacillus toyonensis]
MLSNVYDWDFFWNTFGMLFKMNSSFVMIVIAISAVCLLIGGVIAAVMQKKK